MAERYLAVLLAKHDLEDKAQMSYEFADYDLLVSSRSVVCSVMLDGDTISAVVTRCAPNTGIGSPAACKARPLNAGDNAAV